MFIIMITTKSNRAAVTSISILYSLPTNYTPLWLLLKWKVFENVFQRSLLIEHLSATKVQIQILNGSVRQKNKREHKMQEEQRVFFLKPLYWLKMASGHNIIHWWQNESIGPKLFRQSDLCQDSDIKQCIIGNIVIEKKYFLFSRLWRIDMDGWGKQIPWYQVLHRWIKFPWCTFPRLSSSHIINTDPTTIECFSQEVA